MSEIISEKVTEDTTKQMPTKIKQINLVEQIVDKPMERIKVGDEVVIVNFSGILQLCPILEVSDDRMNFKYRPHVMEIFDQWINVNDTRFLRSLPHGFEIGEIYTDAYKSMFVRNPCHEIILDSNWIVEFSANKFGIKRGWKLIAILGIAIHEYNENKMRKKYEKINLLADLTFDSQVGTK